VYSYEPFEANFNLLADNIKLNKLTRYVKAYQKGVGAERGRKKLFIHSNNTGGHSMYVQSKQHTLINLVTLKDIFTQHNIKKCDVLKMDCEGAEYEILYETPLAYLKKIRSIALEYHTNKNVFRLKKFLEKQGFNVKLEETGIPILYAERN
jgi:FkbM family methyltransferase